MSTQLNIEAINPKLHDKYSPNLFAMLRGQQSPGPEPIGVYQHADETLWIGRYYDGDFIGCRLMSALCYGGKAPIGSYSELDLVSMPEFWDTYTQKGRCAMDPEHKMFFIGDEGRFVRDGDSRECQWCGHKQTLTKWQETVNRERWIDA